MVRAAPVMGAVLMTTYADATSHTDADAAAKPMTPHIRRSMCWRYRRPIPRGCGVLA
jgi:hypothetical protein